MTTPPLSDRPSGAADAIARFGAVRVLVVGDFILDRFIHGSIDRISPEAPIPVLHGRSATAAPGGAGNVVANLVALGGQAIPLGFIGEDAAGATLREELASRGVETGNIIASARRVTSCKTRFSSLNQQVLRFDEEEIATLDADEQALLIERFIAALGEAGIVVLSDYGKGMLLDGVAERLIELAREAGRPVIVDPKGRDYARYRGADIVTPNRKELGEAVGHPVSADAEIVGAARSLISRHGFGAVLATRSERGMSVVSGSEERHIATQAREVFDVSGAGDTVVATVALGLGTGLALADAAELANSAAGVVVGKRGTAQLSADELMVALTGGHGDLRPGSSVVSLDQAVRIVEAWRRDGLKVGFTNGCFDILHAGHVTLLRAARAACDRLVVGLNADASVARLKGPTRPVNGADDRAHVLAALAAVDLVVVFAEDTPLDLIERLKPDVLVKGGDYTIETVVGARETQARGGRVVLVDLVAGRSTTNIIERMASGAARKADA